MTGEKQKFSVVHAEDGEFKDAGLRAQFQYRDLGISEATGGRYHAHVIRPIGGEPPIGMHTHDVIDFQMVYILQGWMKFWYEGQGEITVKEGSCVLQPPGIQHDVLGWSDDLRILEITSPAEFSTETLAAE